MMKTRAAVLRKGGEPWEITELDLDEPKAAEVLIRFEAAGLCHSDEHIRATGTARLPLVGGHEGAGVIKKAGPNVTRVKAGDRVACSYIPVCGTCRYCSTRHQNLCDAGQNAAIGCLVDGTFRFHDNNEDLGGMCVLGTFSERAVISEWSCVNAVQGARYAGGKNVIAIDPVEFKREQAMEFGATHAFADPEQAHEAIVDMTRGQLADKVICTVGEMNNDVVKAAVNMTGKAGTIVITGVGYYDMVLPGGILIGYHRRMQGALFGGANPLYDIPMILGLWQSGDVKLTELVMAGCLPGYFPVVLAAFDALMRERAARGGGWQSTSGPAPLIVVNGPVRHELDVNAAGGAFGPGFRPNATIPRAIGLIVRNAFGIRPHVLGQATQGLPGRWSICLAENEEESPWPPFAIDGGQPAGVSAVSATLLRTCEFVDNRHTPDPEQVLWDIADTISRTGSLIFRDTSAGVVFCPEHAQMLAAAGFAKQDVQTALLEHCGRTGADLRRAGKNGLRGIARFADPDDSADATFTRILPSPRHVPIVVAGARNAAISMVVRVFGEWSGTAIPVEPVLTMVRP